MGTWQPTSRRVFAQRSMQAALAWAAAASTAGSCRASDENSAGWIDAHVHVWSPDTKKYPLDPDFKASDMQPPSFTAEELFRHTRPAGVARVVLIQMSFYTWDHRYMVEVMQAHPGVFSGVALIDFRSHQIADRIAELVALGMRGFRLHSRGDAASWLNEAGMDKLWKRSGELGLAVCPLVNPSDLPVVDALCQRYPQTTVVVDHFGRIGIDGMIAEQDLQRLCNLARYPNTHVKTSAFYALGKKTAPYDDLIPMIRRLVDSFGPERLMWASDCPFQVQGVHNYAASIGLIRDRCDFLSSGDKQWLLRRTAEKVYFYR